MRSVHEFEGIFIHKESVDMRKQINGLCTIVETEMGKDLMGRNLFIFSGRRKYIIEPPYIFRLKIIEDSYCSALSDERLPN